MPRQKNWRRSAGRRGNQFARRLTDNTDSVDIHTDLTCEDVGLGQSSNERLEGCGLKKNTTHDNHQLNELPNELLKNLPNILLKNLPNNLHNELPKDMLNELPSEKVEQLEQQSCYATGMYCHTHKETEHEHDILFGTTHQGSLQFSYETRGRQCTCIALMMLAYKSQGTEITSDLIDSVLLQGDTLYKSVIDNLKEKNRFRDYFLNFDEIPETVSTTGFVHMVRKENSIYGTVLQTVDGDALSVSDGLELAFGISSTSLIIVGSLCSAVMKTDTAYCFFDSHSHGPDGLSSSDGKACAAQFVNFTDLITYI